MVHTWTWCSPALTPTCCRPYLSELPHPLQLHCFFPTAGTIISLLLYFCNVPPGLLASQDALWVIVGTIAEGIIPECKSDYVMSFPKIFSVATHFWVQALLFSTLKLGNLAFAPYPDLTSWCLPQVLMFQPFWTIWADSRISHLSPCLCTLSSAWNAFLPYLP